MIEQVMALADGVATAVLVFTVVPLGMTIYRLLVGPGFTDRFVALDMLSGLAVAMAGLMAVVTGRREYLDVGILVALVGFIGTAALAAFLERERPTEP